MMRITPLVSNTIPLCFLPDGRLLCYHQGTIQLMKNGKTERIISIPTTWLERFFGWSRLATRLMRFGIRAAVACDNDNIVLYGWNKLYVFSIASGQITAMQSLEKGVRPLTFTVVRGIPSFDDGVYFGGYVHNPSMNPVSIYRRVGTNQWEVVYTFPPKTINHIHNIIADPYRECLWVFTGDFDEAAAIWKVTDGFRGVERIVSGDQMWRGCVAFALPEGLLYATDTPFAKNHVCLLKDDGSLSILGNLSGSCIYGCKWKDKYVFSTTVEADGRNESLMKLFFSRKIGIGIDDGFSRIYIGDLTCGFSEVYKEKKDVFPFIFQFGTFKFPVGVNDSDFLYFQPVATSKNDLKLMLIKD